MKAFFLDILEITAGTSLLVLLMLLILRLVGKKFTARCRYILWTLVLLRLAIPFSFNMLPALIEVPVEPTIIEHEVLGEVVGKPPVDFEPAETNPGVQEQIPSTPVTPNIPTNPTVPDSPTTPTNPNIPIIPNQGTIINPGVQDETPSEPVVIPSTPEEPVPEKEPISWSQVLDAVSVVYVVGAAVFLLWTLASYGLYTRKILREARLPDERTLAIYNSICKKENLKKPPLLLISPAVNSPAAFGVFKRKILLPDIVFTQNGLAGTLFHEVTHCKRGDLYIKVIELIARSFHWFNPLAHVSAFRCEMEMEMSCDEKVLSGCNDDARAAYGEVMLDIIRRCRRNRGALTTHFNPKKSSVKARFANIIYGSGKRRGRILIAVCLILCLVAGTIVACTTGDDSPKLKEYKINVLVDEEVKGSEGYNRDIHIIEVEIDSEHQAEINETVSTYFLDLYNNYMSSAGSAYDFPYQLIDTSYSVKSNILAITGISRYSATSVPWSMVQSIFYDLENDKLCTVEEYFEAAELDWAKANNQAEKLLQTHSQYEHLVWEINGVIYNEAGEPVLVVKADNTNPDSEQIKHVYLIGYDFDEYCETNYNDHFDGFDEITWNDIPIKLNISHPTDEFLESYDKTKIIDATSDEYAVYYVITSNVDVEGAYITELVWNDAKLTDSKPLHKFDLKAGEPVVIMVSHPGAISNRALTYTDTFGVYRRFEITRSGEDGSPMLLEIQYSTLSDDFIGSDVEKEDETTPSINVLSNPGGLKLKNINIPKADRKAIFSFNDRYIIVVTANNAQNKDSNGTNLVKDLMLYLIDIEDGKMVGYRNLSGQYFPWSQQYTDDGVILYSYTRFDTGWELESAYLVTFDINGINVTETQFEEFPRYTSRIVSPDGQYIVYALDDDLDEHGGIDVVYPDGSRKRVMEDLPFSEYGLQGCEYFTPQQFIDNTRFIYSSTTSIGLYDISTGNDTTLALNGDYWGYADGYIYYSLSKGYVQSELWKCDTSGEKTQLASLDENADVPLLNDSNEYHFLDGKWFEYHGVSANSSTRLQNGDFAKVTVYSEDMTEELAVLEYTFDTGLWHQTLFAFDNTINVLTYGDYKLSPSDETVNYNPADYVTFTPVNGTLNHKTIVLPHNNFIDAYEFDEEHYLITTYNIEKDANSKPLRYADFTLYLINTVTGTLEDYLTLGTLLYRPTQRHYVNDGLVLFDLVIDEETHIYSVPYAIKITLQNGRLNVAETTAAPFPFYDEKIVSPDGRYTVYHVTDSGSGSGGIDVLYSGLLETTRILTNVMIDDRGVTSLGDVTGYSPIQFIDEHRFLYHIGGWEWTQGYGIYDLSTGEKTEFRNGYGAIGYYDGYIYLRQVSGYEPVAWHKATLDGTIQKIASVNEEDGIFRWQESRDIRFGGTNWRKLNIVNTWEYPNADENAVAVKIYSLDIGQGGNVLAEVTYNLANAEIYTISHFSTETAVVFVKDYVMPDKGTSAEPVVKVLENGNNYRVHTVYIPVNDYRYKVFEYGDGRWIYMTYDNVVDNTGYVHKFTNIHLYLFDTFKGLVVAECDIEGEYRLDTVSTNLDGGVILYDIVTEGDGQYVEGAFAVKYDPALSKLTAEKIDAPLFPRYKGRFVGEIADGTRVTITQTTDGGWSHGGIDLIMPDGTAKRILTNVVLDQNSSGISLSDVAYYYPVGTFGITKLVYGIGSYEGPDKGFGIYDLTTGERKEYVHKNYVARSAEYGCLIYEEIRYTNEGFRVPYRIWMRNHDEEDILLASTDKSDGVFLITDDMFYVAADGHTDNLIRFETGNYREEEDFLAPNLSYTTATLYSPYGMNHKVITIEYPKMSDYYDNLYCDSNHNFTVVVPIAPSAMPNEKPTVFYSVDEVIAAYGDEIYWLADRSYSKEQFKEAVESFIYPEEYRSAYNELYESLSAMKVKDPYITYDKAEKKFYLTFTVTGTPVGTLKVGENTCEIVANAYEIGVLCYDENQNYSTEARIAVHQYINAACSVDPDKMYGMPDETFDDAIFFTDYIVWRLEDLGVTPTRDAVIDYAKRCFGLENYSPRADQFDENGNHVQFGYGGIHPSYAVTSETEENGVVSVTVQFFNHSLGHILDRKVVYRLTKLPDGAWKFIDVAEARNTTEYVDNTPDVITFEFDTIDELMTKFSDEIDGRVEGLYSKDDFRFAVDSFINPEKYKSEMSRARYTALLQLDVENTSVTYDRKNDRMYLNFTVTGTPIGTLKVGENTCEILVSMDGMGVICADESQNYTNEARSAVAGYIAWTCAQGMPESSFAKEYPFTDYIAACLRELGVTPTRNAVIEYAKRCFGIDGYSPLNSQFDESGEHVQWGYGLGNPKFIIIRDTFNNGIHTVTVNYYEDHEYQALTKSVDFRISQEPDGAWKFIDVVEAGAENTLEGWVSPDKFVPEEFAETLTSLTGKKVLFWDKIFVNPMYLYFVPIENGAKEFSVYSYTDYSSVSYKKGEGLHELKFTLPADISFDTAKVVWTGGGGGSGEFQFIVKLTRGDDVTYISYNNFRYALSVLEFEYAGVVSGYELANLAASYPETFMVETYHEAERIYSLFTGYGAIEYFDEVIEYNGLTYQRCNMPEFSSLAELRSLVNRYFSDELTDALMNKTVSIEGLPLYIEQNGKLYRFGGYAEQWGGTPENYTWEVILYSDGEYNTKVTATEWFYAKAVTTSATCKYVVEPEGYIRFTEFPLMIEKLWNVFTDSPYETSDATLALNACIEVLANKRMLHYYPTSSQIYLEDLLNKTNTTAQKYSIVDLNGDNEPEIVLLEESSNYLILHYGDDTVYAYSVPYRGFLNPKADGTFEVSSGASDNGVYKMDFASGECIKTQLAYYRVDFSQTIEYYYLGSNTAPKEQYDAFMDTQRQKPDLEWTNFGDAFNSAEESRPILDVFQEILESNKEFNAYGKEYMSLSEYCEISGYYLNKYAFVNLDSSGDDEMVLWFGYGTNEYVCFLVLHRENGIVYAYAFPYRGFSSLKSDGSFHYSGGASDNGTGKLNFSGVTYTITRLAYCESDPNNSNKVSFYINDKPVSEEEFSAYEAAQDQKPDATWIEYSPNN